MLQLARKNSSAAPTLDFFLKSFSQSPSRQNTCLAKSFAMRIFYSFFLLIVFVYFTYIKFWFSLFMKCFYTFIEIVGAKTFSEFIDFKLKSVDAFFKICIHT